ncbi:MAG: NIPSNAP family protein, partial [Dehalococcoidia bacterium]
MTYEMAFYTFQPRTLPEVEQSLNEAVRAGNGSATGAFFRTEIGPLNQLICVWPSSESPADKPGPKPELPRTPEVTEHLVETESVTLTPAPFMRPWNEPQQLGRVYELRIYDLYPDRHDQVFANWATRIAEREAISPLAGCWVSLVPPNAHARLYHLWPYSTLAERDELRAAAIDAGVWPTDRGQHYMRQETRILSPLP